MTNWYCISNIDEIDSPTLVIYPDRVKENIRILQTFVPDTARLRPHIKTNKSPDVSKLLIEAGILKFKCATIAEAEMLSEVGAKDVLLAYQPTGPKAQRLIELIREYPATQFSCLVDNEGTVNSLAGIAAKNKIVLSVWIDINVGMNRTGIKAVEALPLFDLCLKRPSINPVGLHAYDGHLHDTDLSERTIKCNEGFQPVSWLKEKIKSDFGKIVTIVAGGTPTFPIHAQRKDVECSPGTFIFWDTNYSHILKEQPFLWAALVIARVISKPSENTLCIDLGHKSIASENPLNKRVTFLNAPELEPIGHSEEHLVVKTNQWEKYKVGDEMYGVPFHICPTVALYDIAWTVVDGNAQSSWKIEARKRKIKI